MAQKNSEEYRSKQVGFAISSLSGMGFYYLTDLTYEDNIKISALLLGLNDEDDVRTFDDGTSDDLYSFGLEYQRDLVENSWLRMHVLTGISIDNTLIRFSACSSGDNDCYYTNAGVGIGIDIELGSRVVFNIHSTYQVSRSYGDIEQINHGFGGGIGFALRGFIKNRFN